MGYVIIAGEKDYFMSREEAKEHYPNAVFSKVVLDGPYDVYHNCRIVKSVRYSGEAPELSAVRTEIANAIAAHNQGA